MSDDIASLNSLQPTPDSIQPINTLSIPSNPIQPPQYNDTACNQSPGDGGLGAGFACSGEVKYHPQIYFTNFPESIVEWDGVYIHEDGGLEFFSKVFWEYYDRYEGEHVVEGDVCEFF